MSVTIYHNPRCSTSRNVLAAIRDAGVEPTIVPYLTTPPDEATLRALISDAGLTPRTAVRKRETLYKEIDLANADDETVLRAMLTHPVLIERPFVVGEKGTVLARPAATVSTVL
ncbi:arsenate reductase (glutaredoxin) [Rhodococcus sp. BP-316]|uniref:arsenate reductase (glutaredoxin) n=1 Tax=Rhodococcus sp. BP-316 TaxID=2739445 RepID=UPI001C9A9F1C|nr:arsenate reductase (glutaredoxin) [Rhodococcus sp. BP-316]MBY6681027.1 arsenate reductase (glutaredoxin) [Rhodococcus sp. BP-316]